MKWLSTILLAFTISFSLYSKQHTEPELSFPNNQIKWSPLRMLIDPVNPGLEISYERLYSENLSTQLSVCFLYNFFNTYYYTDFEGMRFGLEQKYFLDSYKDVRLFVSAEFVYYHSAYGMDLTYKKLWWNNDNDAEEKYQTHAEMDKRMAIFNVKMGFHKYFGPFIVDISGGLGIKNKTIEARTSPEKRGDYVFESGTIGEIILDANITPGNHLAITIPLNIKIGYSF